MAPDSASISAVCTRFKRDKHQAFPRPDVSRSRQAGWSGRPVIEALLMEIGVRTALLLHLHMILSTYVIMGLNLSVDPAGCDFIWPRWTWQMYQMDCISSLRDSSHMSHMDKYGTDTVPGGYGTSMRDMPNGPAQMARPCETCQLPHVWIAAATQNS